MNSYFFSSSSERGHLDSQCERCNHHSVVVESFTSFSLFMVEEHPQNNLHSSGLIRFQHLNVCVHWLPPPGAVLRLGMRRKHLWMCAQALSRSFSSIPFLPRYISVLHANELSVVKPEYYRGVCLISLLPFLFPGDYPVFKRNGAFFASLGFKSLPAVGARCQPAFQRLIPKPLPFKCSRWYDIWAGQARQQLCMCMNTIKESVCLIEGAMIEL